MRNKKHIVIVGATSTIAAQCARLWLKDQSVCLSLVGRNKKKLGRLANDLQVRSPNSEIAIFESDFLVPEKIQETIDHIASIDQIYIALIAHGSLPNQLECQNDLNIASDAMFVNGISPMLFAEALALHMQQSNQGIVGIIGSVAGDRGRKSNYIYGAAKGLVARYAQGLQHRFSGSSVRIVLIKPGPTDTPMTAELKSEGAKLAPVQQVAEDIVSGIQKGKSEIYTPKKWWLIMMIFGRISCE